MGLDITAYGNVALLETMESTDDYDEKYWNSDEDSNTDYVWATKDRGQHDNIVEHGVYRYEQEFDFRAGSYSGYNEWRNHLSRLMLKVDAETVWHNSESYKGKPFYELINFSDCEGIIGPETSKKLAADFAAHQPIANDEPAFDGWFTEKYNNWRQAFELASNNGYVKFH